MLEDVDPPLGHDAQAGARLERQPEALLAEDDTAQLGLLVLQRQVEVSRGAARDAADLAFDPHRVETGLAPDRVTHEPVDRGDRQDGRAGGTRLCDLRLASLLRFPGFRRQRGVIPESARLHVVR